MRRVANIGTALDAPPSPYVSRRDARGDIYVCPRLLNKRHKGVPSESELLCVNFVIGKLARSLFDIRLLTVDHSARESMKDAAKCEK